VVNLYLGGGADTFNLLVPINCALHDEYMAVRGEAALGNTKLLEISSSQACPSFGLHYKLPKLRQLYQAGEAVATFMFQDVSGKNMSCGCGERFWEQPE